MRLARPTPELLMPGKWKKTNDKSARVTLSKKEFFAPFDDKESSAAIRVHEYAHIVYSIEKEKINEKMTPGEFINPLLHQAHNALEDHRVNYLAVKEAGVSVKKALEDDEKALLNNIRKVSPEMCAILYASAAAYQSSKVLHALSAKIKDYKKPIDSILEMICRTADEDIAKGSIKERVAENTKSAFQVLDFTRELIDILTRPEPKPKPEESDKSDKPGKSKGKGKSKKDDKDTHKPGEKPERGEPEKEKPEEKPDPKPELTPEEKRAKREKETILTQEVSDWKADHDEVSVTSLVKETKYTASLVKWGEMNIVIPPMSTAQRFAGVKLRPRKRASQFGATFRYVHRLLSDKAIFATPKKDNLGTVLIDWSGSMHIDLKDLQEMLKFSGYATIAVYYGRNTEGTLTILSRNGQSVSAIPPRLGGSNVIDKPALDWLSTQPQPRWWICDGQVTGIEDRTSEEVSQACRKIKKDARIKQVSSMGSFIKLIRADKLRNYKDVSKIY